MGGMGTDERVNVGIIAVQPSTGDVIYDEFSDGFMRSEIETRLLHIAPCELLIVGELSRATDKLVTHLAGSTYVFVLPFSPLKKLDYISLFPNGFSNISYFFTTF